MRITLLGTGSADGWPNPFCSCASCSAERTAGRSRAPSSALVDGVVLIDCGPTTPHLPGGSGVDLRSVEHVLVTHGHPDHLHPAFLLSRRWTAPERTLHVWGPALAIDGCRDWIGEGSAVELHVLSPGDVVDLPSEAGTYVVRALAAQHAHGDGDVMAAEALIFAIDAPDGGRLLYATDTGPFNPFATGVSGVPFDCVVVDETFGDKTDHGTGHLDLVALPALLSALRVHGAVDDTTTVVATHLSHHNPPAAQLRGRLADIGVHLVQDLDTIDTARPQGGLALRHLILGGARSGKSHFAEQCADVERVTYVATGGTRDDDPEWTERVARHRSRRPSTWTTVETTDVASVLADVEPGTIVLVDCLALWLTAQLDALDAWSRAEAGQHAALRSDVDRLLDDLCRAIAACPADVILVSNEVGMGVVPATVSGRVFRDLLGITNMRVAGVCNRTTLVVAGIPVPLPMPTNGGPRAD